MRSLKSISLVLGVWIAFFGMQIVLSIALARRGPAQLASMVEVDLAVAVLWASMSFAIAAWHRTVRALAPNVLLLIVLHLPTLFVAALADTAITRAVMLAIDPARQITPFWAFLVYYADFDIVSYVAVVAVAEALLVRGALVARQQLAKRLETSLSRARLDYLEAQLQPHFLFNSLGAVSELAYDAPATANRVLRQLDRRSFAPPSLARATKSRWAKRSSGSNPISTSSVSALPIGSRSTTTSTMPRSTVCCHVSFSSRSWRTRFATV